MHVVARIQNNRNSHRVTVSSSGNSRTIAIPAKQAGPGSDVNGGELLMLAVATCYGNDLYREAVRMGIELRALEVIAEADFEGVGLAASNIRYRARVDSPASHSEIDRLLRETDAVAEIHNTIRAGRQVAFEPWNCEAAVMTNSE